MSEHLLWPLRGLLWVLARPRLWLRPLIAQILLLALVLTATVSTVLMLWPAPGMTGWNRFLQVALALAGGPAAGIAAWMLCAPLLTALVLDALAAAVRREAGQPVHDPGLWSAVHALWKTVPERLLWLAVVVVSLLLGPFGPFLAAYALGRTAALDAFDTALAAADRRPLLPHHASDLRHGAVVAGGLYLLLSLGFVAWLWWMPALVCGAALRTLAATKTGTAEEVP